MNMRRFMGSVVFAASLLVPGTVFAQGKHHSDTFVPGTSDEAHLLQEVRHQLAMLPYYTIFDDLGFRVDGTNITLEGAVTNPVLKSDAENVVKRVEGVTQVTNNIEVLPVSPMDWQTRRAVARAIYGSPEIGDKYGYQALPSIHIIVKNGNVTLEGIVDNNFDRILINTKANTVPNVFHVTNNLQVVSGK